MSEESPCAAKFRAALQEQLRMGGGRPVVIPEARLVYVPGPRAGRSSRWRRLLARVRSLLSFRRGPR